MPQITIRKRLSDFFSNLGELFLLPWVVPFGLYVILTVITFIIDLSPNVNIYAYLQSDIVNLYTIFNVWALMTIFFVINFFASMFIKHSVQKITSFFWITSFLICIFYLFFIASDLRIYLS